MQEGMSADDVSAVFAERISPRLVDLKTGQLLDKDPAKYNPGAGAERSADEPDARSIARSRRD